MDLNVFHLGDYGIPYGYSPVLIATESYLQCATAAAFLSCLGTERRVTHGKWMLGGSYVEACL